MSESEAKLLAIIIVVCLVLTVVNHWFTPKGWIGIYLEQHK
jgi:hypothetical protein